MAHGKVKWFNAMKGYGFIEPDEGGEDVFLHRKNINGLEWDENLKDGDEVNYEVEQTPQGLAAANVERRG